MPSIVGTGLRDSVLNMSGSWLSCLEPARDDPRSLGVLLPVLEPGRLPTGSPNGKGGKAQSRFADSSGLGGRGSQSLGIGLVIDLRGGGGLPLKLLPDLLLAAGEIGDSDLAIGAKNGRFAA